MGNGLEAKDGKMGRGFVDLRSDTLTKPTAEMRRAMAEAEVGDDVYGEDPTVNRLEQRAAEIFGMDAALFVPTGCMGNLIAIKVWTHHGDEVICEERSHVSMYELAAMSAIAGCMPRTVRGEGGILSWKTIEGAIRPKIYYDSQTALVCIENTFNMAGGEIHPTAQVDEICGGAHAAGLKVHLDGARIFNAAVALGEDVARMTRNVDSVMFCLSKGLGAPVGSMIAGTRAFIEKARVYRKMVGGGMRQAGILAAAGRSSNL
jgi:threonine aldolase